MSELRIVTDPEEIDYAKKVAVSGVVIPHNGKNYYAVSYIKLLTNISGAVRVGCVVETEKERDIKLSTDQDFGSLKIMFYALFDQKQAEKVAIEHPDIPFYSAEHNGSAIFLTWQEYKHLVKIN